jgi:hypothetical protein
MGYAALKLNPDGTFRLSENDIEAQVRDFLESLGWMRLRNHVGLWTPAATAHRAIDREDKREGHKLIDSNVAQMHPEAFPDWAWVHSHYPVLFLEVKAPGKKPTDKQQLWLDKLKAAHFLATWTDGLDNRHKCNSPLIPWYQANVPASACSR